MNITITELETKAPHVVRFRVVIDNYSGTPLTPRDLIRMVTYTCFAGREKARSRKAVEVVPGVWEVVHDWSLSRMDDLGRQSLKAPPPTSDKIGDVIDLLSNIRAKDLDECSVEKLTQLQYWLQRHQGSIFVKAVGKMTANDAPRGT